MISETSPTDGKIYTVQYFERAVFEAHPENTPPNDVLLSLLGVFLYKQKYPTGAPGQVVNTSPTSRLFGETGKRVGGRFLDYWDTHGGLAQQGLPISDEFVEVSPLDGKPYKVQYFERAVFEFHPENTGTQFDVLLSQLGRFRYDAVYQVKPTQPVPQATATTQALPAPTGTPSVTLDCNGIPPGTGVAVAPNCGPYGTVFNFTASGFAPRERVTYFITRPDGTIGSPDEAEADASGLVFGPAIQALSPAPGNWAVTMVGASERRMVGYFKVTGPDISGCTDGPPPLGRDASVSPACGVKGYTRFYFAGRGFIPGEDVGVYLTLPNQVVYGSRFQETANKDGYVVGTWFEIYDIPQNLPGVWTLTYEGVTSHRKIFAYFKLYPR